MTIHKFHNRVYFYLFIKFNFGNRKQYIFKHYFINLLNSRLDYPYSDCVKDISSPNGFDSMFFKAIFNILNMTIYRQKVCARLCLQDYVIAKCNCTDGSLPNIYQDSLANTSTCNTLQVST